MTDEEMRKLAEIIVEELIDNLEKDNDPIRILLENQDIFN